MICPTCNGAGSIPDTEFECQATIVVGHETFSCYATRPHPGAPHMALACKPCPQCGGYDEHAETCPLSVAETDAMAELSVDQGWLWNDGDEALTSADEEWFPWRDQFRPREQPVIKPGGYIHLTDEWILHG